MTVRECDRRVCLFQKPQRIPNYEGGVTERQRRHWAAQGFPQTVDFNAHFGLDPKLELCRRVSFDPIPGLPDRQKNLPQSDEYWVVRTPWGKVVGYPKERDEDDAESSYHVYSGALKDPADWQILREQFKPDIEARYGLADTNKPWAQEVQRLNSAPHVRVLEGPSMVGGLCFAIGFEDYCLNLYDHPQMMEEMVEKRTQLAIQILGKALDEIEFDMLWFWEDMAYRGGPIISPAMFEWLAVPRYKRLADWYRARGGQIVAVDSDGDVRPLIPGWIRGGINHIWPLEPRAGVDVVALRKEYGQAFSMRGGVDKFCVTRGREGIDRELDRVFPVVQDGGFIPHLDHMVPLCPFEDYCYYIERKKQMLAGV